MSVGASEEKESSSDGPVGDYDEMLPQAVEVVLEMGSCSVSMLQRRLKLGYSRAARIVDQMEEIGDVLFTVVNVSRFLKIDSEHALYKACDKFINRFTMLEELAKERGIDVKEASMTQLDSLWEEVKIIQKQKIYGGN